MTSLGQNIRVCLTNNSLIVIGNTSSYIKNMKPLPKEGIIDKIMHKHPIMPYSIKWNSLTKNNVIFCIRPDNGQHYYFKMNNIDNIQNDNLIPKIGVYYFHTNKYNTYIC